MRKAAQILPIMVIMYFFMIIRENEIANYLKSSHIPKEVAHSLTKVAQIIVGLAFIGASVALIKAISLRRTKIGPKVLANLSSNGTRDKAFLTERQLSLFGLQPAIKDVAPESSKNHQKANL